MAVVHHLKMIFLIDRIKEGYEIAVYEDLPDLTNRVEWQDIYQSESIIADETGIIYEWDSSKDKEYGSVFNYTLIQTEKRVDLIDKLLESYNQENCPDEFIMRKD